MLGRRGPEQYEFFAGSLRDLIPDEHVLARVDRVLDLSWLRDEVAGQYSAETGRPSIDPEAAVRLMLAGFLLGLVHDRRLMREAAVNVAIRWFARFGLTEPLPDHSSLTRIRQRWGAARFRRIFERTVTACVAAGIAKGEVVHVDATLIRADVSWEALAQRWVETVEAENEPIDVTVRDGKQTGKYKKVCTTDPDATMATTGRHQRLEPAYKQHTAVCDQAGVIVDVEATTGELNEGGELVPAIERVEAVTGTAVAIVSADAGYAYAKVYGALERRGIAAVIPPKAEPIRSSVPMRRFRYDARHDRLICPRGKALKPGRRVKHGRFFTARARDCRRCDLARLCLSGGRVNKAVVVGDDYAALLRARRRRERWSDHDKAVYTRHRWRVEGVHGEAKTRHGLVRAVRRGLTKIRIQVYLMAAAINLKRLAAATAVMLCAFATILTAQHASAPRSGRTRAALAST
ncbi:IS1182 family transposase [Elioraea tepidiphila]|jgi:transposase|uniref:IS1182 family transposase n=1 Tax=Elioraea tepidiphila TaxID=457934 RepID=UPI00036CC7F3|nr:IS1182 family transposase [Elioraea tepidiphila]